MAFGEFQWWINFFTNAGIAPKLAAKYALMFVHHHIQKNMMLDLNFDILKMMGITAMGDNIAILKHARSVNDEKDLETVMPKPIIVNKVNPMRTVCDEEDDENYEEEEEEEEDSYQMIDEIPNMKKPHAVIKQTCDDYPRNSPAPTNRKTTNVTVKRHINLPVDEVSEKKMRVEPVKCNYEGTLTVKLPVGSTPRSRELLNKYKEQKVQTAFDTFGDCNASSTTQPKIMFNNVSLLEQNSISVFNRLGNKSLENALSKNETADYESLQYKNILKNVPAQKICNKSSSTSITTLLDKHKVPVKVQAAPPLTTKPILVKKTPGLVKIHSEGNLSKNKLVIKTSSVKNRLESTRIKSDKTIPILPNMSSEDLQEEEINVIKPSQTSKRVTFGETQHRYIPQQFPRNCGSIVLQTGVFGRKR